MKRINLFICIVAASILFACRKDESIKSPLPSSAVSIQGVALKDSVVKQVSIGKDSAIVIAMKAVLNNGASTSEHIVNFRTDSTRITAYRAKYGAATLLPASSYYFFQSQCRIPAGAITSDSVQLNIVAQKKLEPLTVYVLPVVIANVDADANPVTPGQVFYIVVKTGKRPTISKDNWKIVSVTSEDPTAPATELLDNAPSTVWGTQFGVPMPQGVTIDFGEQLSFRRLSYTTPADYFAYGGYATKVKIEVSDNGSTWIDKGSFDGTTKPIMEEIVLGATSARYLRFTVLSSAPFFGFDILFLGDISLYP